uniref:RING-type E3 ubiquitin transferase n=1 Tax=Brassica oleracea var. oleracea TaxID=109376 RepID=A0A0D3CTQ7_BRAOL
MNHQPHVSYSFSSDIEPATTDPDRQLTIKITRRNTSQTEINFSIRFSTTDNGHITDDTTDLMEHMFSYHDIYFPIFGEIIEYTSDKFASMIPTLTDYAALIDLRASIREPILEDADKVCSICQDKFIGKGDVNSLRCNHIYHHLCIVEWIRHNLSCPTCRDTHF